MADPTNASEAAESQSLAEKSQMAVESLLKKAQHRTAGYRPDSEPPPLLQSPTKRSFSEAGFDNTADDESGIPSPKRQRLNKEPTPPPPIAILSDNTTSAAAAPAAETFGFSSSDDDDDDNGDDIDMDRNNNDDSVMECDTQPQLRMLNDDSDGSESEKDDLLRLASEQMRNGAAAAATTTTAVNDASTSSSALVLTVDMPTLDNKQPSKDDNDDTTESKKGRAKKKPKKIVLKFQAWQRNVGSGAHKAHVLLLVRRARFLSLLASDARLQSAMMSLLPLSLHPTNYNSSGRYTSAQISLSAIETILTWFRRYIVYDSTAPTLEILCNNAIDCGVEQLTKTVHNRRGNTTQLCILFLALCWSFRIPARHTHALYPMSHNPTKNKIYDGDIQVTIPPCVCQKTTVSKTKPKKKPRRKSHRPIVKTLASTRTRRKSTSLSLTPPPKKPTVTVTEVSDSDYIASMSDSDDAYTSGDTKKAKKRRKKTKKAQSAKKKRSVKSLKREKSVSASQKKPPKPKCSKRKKWNRMTECIEVYCSDRQCWIHIILETGKMHLSAGSKKQIIESRASAHNNVSSSSAAATSTANTDGWQSAIQRMKCDCECAKPRMSYVVSVDEFGFIYDSTPRYVQIWSNTLRSRSMFEDFWQTTITQWQNDNDLLLCRFAGLHPMAHSALSEALQQSNATELQLCIDSEPIPAKVAMFRNHPLYCIEKFVKKYECIYPKRESDVLATVGEYKVYPKSHLQDLHTRKRWHQMGWKVRSNVQSMKQVKSLLSVLKSEKGEAEMSFLFGKWQCDEYIPETAKDGIVPKNERGNVGLWSKKHMPFGCVHIKKSEGWRAAKKLNIDYAKAMVGFDIRHGHNVPVFEGIVVCSEFEEEMNELCDELEKVRIEKKETKEREEIYGFWRMLVEGIVVTKELEQKRAEMDTKRKTHNDFSENHSDTDEIQLF